MGPVAAPMYASENLKNYRAGIFNDPLCISNIPNHAVLLVGYGIENGVSYWIARNSWGESWGENGYFRVLRDANMCNIGFGTYYPIINF